MKKLLYILLFTISAISFAQDPQLFENTWHLRNVIIDGQDNFPPNNDEVNDIIADFSEDGFFTNVCNELTGFIEYYNETFVFPQPLETTFIMCNLQVNEDFEALYFNFYTMYQTQPFTYSITTGPEDSKTLTVTSASGDQAIYGNQLLSTGNFGISLFSIYPNPVNDELYLKNLSSNTGNLKIKIYDLTGKLLISTDTDTDIFINVEGLKAGVYFMIVGNEKGGFQTEKLVKI